MNEKSNYDFMLETLVENELNQLRLKALWWLTSGILITIIGIAWLIEISGYEYYEPSFLIKMYSLTPFLIGIMVLIFGIIKTVLVIFSSSNYKSKKYSYLYLVNNSQQKQDTQTSTDSSNNEKEFEDIPSE